MTINIYEIDVEHRLVPVSREQVSERYRHPDTVLWLDIEKADESERNAWLDRLGIDGLARRLCLDAADRPGLYPLKREMVLVIPVLSEVGGEPQRSHLTCLCRQGLLLTLHDWDLANDERLADLAQADAWLSGRNIAALLSALLIDLSMEYLGLAGNLRDAIVVLEQRMDKDPESVEAEEIMALRSHVLTLASAVGDLLPVTQAVSATERPFFQLDSASDFMRCALVNLQAADGQLTWLDGRVAALRAGFEMHAQEKINRRLGVLTILSAVFMPVTTLAGIWGMNFARMPELGLPYAYPAALSIMVVVGGGVYLFFLKSGWFD